MVRRRILSICAAVVVLVLLLALLEPGALWAFVVVGPVVGLALRDAFQREHTVLRNFPLIGHIRYGLESIRPEIQQYLIESNVDAYPVEREFRSLVYQRAKGALDTRPFGTHRDVYAVGYEWAAHSMAARHLDGDPPRVTVGGPECTRPYEASLLNISAMSFGALSDRAILALNGGARLGGFAHNTGEGGIADQHLEGGGDLIWQIGTGYFGCRTADGGFDPERFRDGASNETVRMIEIKLSQGAKPGHGGVLPGVKNTPLIARIRGVEAGTTVVSPPAHSAFDSPAGLLEFVARLRSLSGGKPVGFKLCIGRRTDFLAICKAMVATGITPDFVTVDGGEGGTGAAPLEYSNSMGMPARDAWVFAHSALVGVGLRDRVRIIASGRMFSAFHMIRALAMGADLCASARGFMLALGCIQSLRCNTNACPTGIATQDERLTWGLDVDDKRARVARFQAATVRAFSDLLGSMGLEDPADLAPHHIYRRVDDLRVRHLGELYDYLTPGQLLDDASVPEGLREEWAMARADRWTLGPEAGPHGGGSLRETA
jgi:glutamate synthase domain-containing protein 2